MQRPKLFNFFSCALALVTAVIGPVANSAIVADNQLRINNNQYVSHATPYYREGAKSESTSIGVLLKNQWSTRKSLSAFLNLADDYSTSENWNYVKPYEAYVQYRLSANFNISLGRKLSTWTNYESEWGQGVFQPRYLMNKLHPEMAGLTGLFFEQSAGKFNFTLAALPVFIPDFGIHCWIKDNKFVSANPWFSPPTTKFKLQGQTGDIHYSINQPPIEDVVFHPGVATKFEFEDSSYQARLSLAYKPIPYLMMGFPSNGLVIGANSDYMRIDVGPRVLYHRLVSLDQAGKVGSWSLGASLTYEQPDNDPGPETWTSAQFETAWIWSAELSRAIETDGPSAARLKLGFLKIEGGNASDRGSLASTNTKFEQRYQYDEAYSLALVKPWRGLFRFPIDTQAKIIYDRLQNGGVFGLSIAANLSRDLRASFESEWLGLLAGPAEVDNFLARYRSNDRIGLGMSYVF